MKTVWRILICIPVLFWGGCTHTPSTSTIWDNTTSPLVSPLDIQSQIRSSDGRNLTAMEAWPLAQAQAHTWDANAVLIGIQPSREMQSNLGLPPDKLGWFYQFQVPSTRDELFVHIVDDQVYGTTIAHPMGDSPLFTFQTIDIKQINLDSSDVVKIYLESSDGKEYSKNHREIQWDFRLVFLSTSPHPVWTLYDSKYPGVNLVNIDAITGQVVRDPFP